MDNTVYKIIYNIAKLKKMSLAAEELHLTPSAVSHAVSNAEMLFGFDLFIRKREGMILTSAGKELLPYIQSVLESESSLNCKLSEINNRTGDGVIRLGVFNSVCCSWLPDIIHDFAQKRPDVRLAIHEGSYAYCEEGLANGLLDAAFVHFPMSMRNVRCSAVYEDPIVLVGPKDWHPDGEEVSYSELEAANLFFAEEIHAYDVEDSARNSGITLSTDHSIDDDTSTMALAGARLGLGILPKLVVESIPGNVSVWPLEGNPKRIIGLAMQEALAEDDVYRDLLKVVCNRTKIYEKEKSQEKS